MRAASRDAGLMGEPVNAAGRSPPGSVPGTRLRTQSQPEIPWLPPLLTSQHARQHPRSNNSISSPSSHPASRGAPRHRARGRRWIHGADPSLRVTSRRSGPSQTPGLWRSRRSTSAPRQACSQHPCSIPTTPASGSRARAPTRRGSSSRPRWRRPTRHRATTARRCPSTSWLRASSRTRSSKPWRAGAAHAEHLPGSGEEAGPRQGFLLGDGTGVGRGMSARGYTRTVRIKRVGG